MPKLSLPFRPGAWLARITRRMAAAALALAATWVPAQAVAGGCDGVAHCVDLGAFTATVVKVNVTRQDAVTAYQGVRSTVRFTNTGAAPLILGYRGAAVTDNNGLAYRWSNKAYGIGVVSRGSADTQFQLAPGESRDASFESVLQYSMRRQVAGNLFSHDITLVQMELLGGRQVREVRDHLLSFSGLTATSGFGAGASAAAAAGGSTPDAAAGTSGGTAGGDGCAGAAHCQATGPIVARVVRVNVTCSGNVTAYQTVRTTIRFTNAGTEPLVLGYLNGSGRVSDNTGQAYRWSSKAYGIGVVSGSAADPQFRLAPGESREAAFESTLQYNVRRAQPGNLFSHDVTIVQLAIVGPSQMRTLHEYALSFSDLAAGNLGAGGAAGVAGQAVDAVDAVNKVVDLFKSLKR